MDISEINKVASRKRLSSDVEKLRERVAQENKKIIKLKVAQDTAYWDLKERLRQVEVNHEKLQQNMLEVQMQYETVSGQYQDELKKRAETLNKLASNRQICTVLEEYCERLRSTLTRCKADQVALAEAYQQSGDELREMHTQQVQRDETNMQTIANLKEQLDRTMEHQNQLVQFFNEEKQRAATDIKELKDNLAAAMARSEDLLSVNKDMKMKLERNKYDLEKKDEDISKLQKNIKELLQEFQSQANEMNKNMLKVEMDLKAALESNDSLKQALNNQEEFTKTVCEQNNQMQEKLAALEDENGNSKKLIAALETELSETKDNCNVLKTEGEALIEKSEMLLQEISDKNEILANTKLEVQQLKDQISAKELEKVEILDTLNKAHEEAAALRAKIDELSDTSVDMSNKLKEIDEAMITSKNASEKTIEELKAAIENKKKELENIIETKNKELQSRTLTINQLMNQVKNISDASVTLENVIHKLKQELVEEKDFGREREKRLEQLEISIKNKDNELSKNMTIILELRSDKERLNEIIQNMQNKINNVQKELTRSAETQPRIEAEQDDNAVMLTPANRTNEKELVPPPPPKMDSRDTMFNFFSDSSMECETLENYRSRAYGNGRGKCRSPMPSSGVHRRRPLTPAVQGGLRHKTSAKNEDLLAPSEAKATMQAKPRSFFKTKRQDKKISSKNVF